MKVKTYLLKWYWDKIHVTMAEMQLLVNLEH